LVSSAYRHRGFCSPVVGPQPVAARIFPAAVRLLADQNSGGIESSASLRPCRCSPPRPGLRHIPAITAIDMEKTSCNASHNFFEIEISYELHSKRRE
jgi:hypothetical protein